MTLARHQCALFLARIFARFRNLYVLIILLSRHWYAKEQHNGKKKKHLGDACQYQFQKLKISGDSSMMTHHQQLDGAMITSRKLMIPRRKNSFQRQKKTVKGHSLYLCNRKKKPPNKKSSILSDVGDEINITVGDKVQMLITDFIILMTNIINLNKIVRHGYPNEVTKI